MKDPRKTSATARLFTAMKITGTAEHEPERKKARCRDRASFDWKVCNPAVSWLQIFDYAQTLSNDRHAVKD